MIEYDSGAEPSNPREVALESALRLSMTVGLSDPDKIVLMAAAFYGFLTDQQPEPHEATVTKLVRDDS